MPTIGNEPNPLQGSWYLGPKFFINDDDGPRWGLPSSDNMSGIVGQCSLQLDLSSYSECSAYGDQNTARSLFLFTDRQPSLRNTHQHMGDGVPAELAANSNRRSAWESFTGQTASGLTLQALTRNHLSRVSAEDDGTCYPLMPGRDRKVRVFEDSWTPDATHFSRVLDSIRRDFRRRINEEEDQQVLYADWVTRRQASGYPIVSFENWIGARRRWRRKNLGYLLRKYPQISDYKTFLPVEWRESHDPPLEPETSFYEDWTGSNLSAYGVQGDDFWVLDTANDELEYEATGTGEARGVLYYDTAFSSDDLWSNLSDLTVLYGTGSAFSRAGLALRHPGSSTDTCYVFFHGNSGSSKYIWLNKWVTGTRTDITFLLATQTDAPQRFTVNGSSLWGRWHNGTSAYRRVVTDTSITGNNYAGLWNWQSRAGTRLCRYQDWACGDDFDTNVVYVDGTGFSHNSMTLLTADQGYLGDIRYSISPTGGDATYSFTGLSPGLYQVYTAFARDANRATDTPFKIYDGTVAGGTQRVSTTVNQESFTTDWHTHGHWFVKIGTDVKITSGTLTVYMGPDTSANQYIIADVCLIVPPELILPLIPKLTHRRNTYLSILQR